MVILQISFLLQNLIQDLVKKGQQVKTRLAKAEGTNDNGVKLTKIRDYASST